MDRPSLMFGDNAAFLDQQYRAWRQDPGSVDPAWAAFFAEQAPGAVNGMDLPREPRIARRSIFAGGAGSVSVEKAKNEVSAAEALVAKVAQLINAYRVRGHFKARIDPLGLREKKGHREITLEGHGLSNADLERTVSTWGLHGMPATATLREIVERLEAAYCGPLGVEYMNIDELEQKLWVQQKMETFQDRKLLDRDDQLFVLKQISDAENFERQLHTTFPGTKRFSLEGAEPLVPLMSLMVEKAADLGVEEIVVGMAHRGRLNVLANVLEKPVRQIIDEFRDRWDDEFTGTGDVKYHLGYSTLFETRRQREVMVSMAFNPSHLEAVDPVVEGRVRARQDRAGGDPGAVLPLLLHGDAAFAGQGLVAEVLNLSALDGYHTGGTIHVVVNNQIGFTTSPHDGRSTEYCTAVARMLSIPLLHVNGEDPKAVAAAVELATEWRQRFGRDVVIDLYCYRLHGHNEGDEPAFTQPLEYEVIRKRDTPREHFAARLVEEDLTPEDVERVFRDSKTRLHQVLEADPDEKWDSFLSNERFPLGLVWRDYKGKLEDVDTTFDQAQLIELMTRATEVPEGFHLHPKLKRLFKQRRAMLAGERPLDWAMGEQAAYATLAYEGYRVRLSGQDCGRGTFTHRHANLTDIKTGEGYTPLAHVHLNQAPVEVYDSLLSEAAVLGFEFGYALDYPDGLVMWEAQFGDFANGAQVIIDQFITSTEQKWNRLCGVVLLLPHGYEGQGPEHSSARLERFLQLCAQDNILVVNITTPGNLFHCLRRQCHLRTRKPLVVMSPKSLLRHPKAVSSLEDLATGQFQKVLPDAQVDPAAVKRVVFCSGKVYYELLQTREDQGQHQVALVRLEQLYPFPRADIEAELSRYADGVEVVWCQEEPRNMGAWPMMDEWMGEVLGGRPPRYIGRPRMAAPATGSSKAFRAAQAELCRLANTLE